MLKKVTIIGLGMMGASISLAIKKQIPDVRTVAIVRREQYVKPALENKIVDEIYVGLRPCAFETDIIIISVPVLSVLKVIEDIKAFLQKETIVTDIGSVKKDIMDHAKLHYENSFEFIGSHPMCGSEKSGMEYGHADLFEGATCVLTPGDSSHPENIKKLMLFWKTIGCHVIKMDAVEHDRQVAIVSHMPHLLSSVLINHIFDTQEDKKGILNVAGTGFSDMTRLAEGKPSLWMDIFESNLPAIIEAASNYKESLENIINALKDNNKEKLFEYLKAGQKHKQDFEKIREKKNPD